MRNTRTDTGKWTPLPENRVITESGRYRLTEDIVATGPFVIRVASDDVLLDLGGYEIRHEDDTIRVDPCAGILVQYSMNVTVRNGTLSGWNYGILTTECKNLVLSDLTVRDIWGIGLNIQDVDGALIAGNRIGPYVYESPVDNYVIGINARAKDCVIIKNHICGHDHTVNASGETVEGVHILCMPGEKGGYVIARNLIEWTNIGRKTYGIWLADNLEAFIAANDIRNAAFGVAATGNRLAVYDNHIHCEKQLYAFGDMEVEGVHIQHDTVLFANRNTFVNITKCLVASTSRALVVRNILKTKGFEELKGKYLFSYWLASDTRAMIAGNEQDPAYRLMVTERNVTAEVIPELPDSAMFAGGAMAEGGSENSFHAKLERIRKLIETGNRYIDEPFDPDSFTAMLAWADRAFPG